MRLDSYRTRGSNGVNDIRTAGRWYLGGRSEANAGSTSTVRSQIPRDLTLRRTVRDQRPDQSPILHRDHPPNLSGWPLSTVVMASFSSVADTAELMASTRGPR
jgi:hypothetical protein